jgi:mycothiol synthase
MLGTDPEHQGKGIGRTLLLAGLNLLHRRGLQVAELTVDSENTTACSLYESLGFQVQARSIWYEKIIS